MVIYMSERISSGIPGLDEMMNGGFPKGSVIVLLGSCGTGKTTFSLQFLMNGLMRKENCMLITLEESVDSIVKNGQTFGWDIETYLKNKQLSILKVEPTDVKTAIQKIKTDLPEVLKERKIERFALDSISLFTMLFESDFDRRQNLFRLVQIIKSANVTALFTSEVNPLNPGLSRDGLVEYVADGVISLELVQPSLHSLDVEPRLRIIKMRGTAHERKVKPYTITSKGIDVRIKAQVF